MAYKSVGEFDSDALHSMYDDPVPFLEQVTEAGKDMHVMEVSEDHGPELWHDDYDAGDGAWVEAGEFEDWHAAMDAASGFPDNEAIGVFDYGDSQAKLMLHVDV